VLILTMGVALLTFVLWLHLMWRAHSGEKWEPPLAGDTGEEGLGLRRKAALK
jgi:uncharacterized membrane protein